MQHETFGWFLAFLASINPLVRLWYPSQYTPAYHMVDSWISHPLLARFLATISEPVFLWAEATCLGLPFWSGWMGWLTILGESVSWFHIINQSELFGIVEDSIWMTVQLAAILEGGKGPILYIVTYPFLTYMFLVHQPRQIKRIFEVKVFEGWTGSKRHDCDADTFAWIWPSLLGEQFAYSLYLWYIWNYIM